MKTQKNIRKHEAYRLAFKMIDDGMSTSVDSCRGVEIFADGGMLGADSFMA